MATSISIADSALRLDPSPFPVTLTNPLDCGNVVVVLRLGAAA